jgi:hypothetical protein
MEIRRNAAPWTLKGCVAVREQAMYAARGGWASYGRTGVRTSGVSEWDAWGSEAEMGVQEALQLFVR